jgi:NitT/TauT family transport system permease protein
LIGSVADRQQAVIPQLCLLISTAQGAFNANGVFAAMIILAVMALAAEYVLTLVENHLVRWRPPALADT